MVTNGSHITKVEITVNGGEIKFILLIGKIMDMKLEI